MGSLLSQKGKVAAVVPAAPVPGKAHAVDDVSAVVAQGIFIAKAVLGKAGSEAHVRQKSAGRSFPVGFSAHGHAGGHRNGADPLPVLKNSQGDGLMAYISRKDCAKALAYALHRGGEYSHAVLNINGPELMTISKFIEYGNQATGNSVSYQELTDEENYQVFDAMGVPRTTDGVFLEGSEAPFSSDGMVTFAQAIREGKMAIHTDDFQKLTGQEPITVLYMFQHADEFQVGDRHSEDA